MDDPDLPLDPPVHCSKPHNSMLGTVGEAIDYINDALTEEQQGHPLVRTTREALYYAIDTGLPGDTAMARDALERALHALKIGGQ